MKCIFVILFIQISNGIKCQNENYSVHVIKPKYPTEWKTIIKDLKVTYPETYTFHYSIKFPSSWSTDTTPCCGLLIKAISPNFSGDINRPNFPLFKFLCSVVVTDWGNYVNQDSATFYSKVKGIALIDNDSIKENYQLKKNGIFMYKTVVLKGNYNLISNETLAYFFNFPKGMFEITFVVSTINEMDRNGETEEAFKKYRQIGEAILSSFEWKNN